MCWHINCLLYVYSFFLNIKYKHSIILKQDTNIKTVCPNIPLEFKKHEIACILNVFYFPLVFFGLLFTYINTQLNTISCKQKCKRVKPIIETLGAWTKIKIDI